LLGEWLQRAVSVRADVCQELNMASKLPVWGIDVGQCSLKAIKLQQAGDQVEMLAFDIVEHETILSQAAGNAAELAKKAIETFLSRQNLRDSQVVVSVPGQQTLTRFTKMPPVEAKKIPDMVQYEASQQIPFDMDEVVWDYQVFTEKDSPDVEVGIFAIRKELIRNYLMQFTDAGISPFIVQSSPMASYNAARFEQPTEPGKATILLDMGALATDLIVMEGNRIWSRPVPIGGNRFTEALVSAFKISFGKAERLKKTAAASKHARQIFQAMRPVLADLVSEIQRSIGYYTSTHRDAHITRVIGMGNAFKLPGLQKFLQQNLQIEVEKLMTFKKMSGVSDKAPEFVENAMSFGVAYGLAVQGLGLASVGSNLLPQEVRRTLLWRQKKPWFAGAAAALALAAGALWVGNVMARGQMEKALGGMANPEVVPIPSLQEAQRIVDSGSSDPPLLRAAKVAGAADRLKQEYSKVSGQQVGDEASLKAMNNLLDNDVFVPRIVDMVHRAFEQASPSTLKEVKNSQDYIREMKKIPRPERKELWILNLDMRYHTTDVASLLKSTAGGNPNPDEPKSGRGGPGWVVEVVGETTQRESTPTWLEATLFEALKKVGREPGRGYYVEDVILRKVGEKGAGVVDAAMSELGASPGDRGGGGRGAPSAPGGPTNPRGRGRPTADSGAGPVPVGRGPGREATRGGGGGDEPVVASGAQREEILKRYREDDPIFDEPMAQDWQFRIYIVIRKADAIPKNLLSEENKQQVPEKQESKPEAKQPEGAPPPPAEERRD
jgi:type IV pilus assembly protein PilM